MKILLILASGPMYKYKTGIFKKPLRYAPLTLTTLASLIPSELEAKVEIVDEGIEVLNGNTGADLVGICAITGTSDRAYTIADYFRKRGIPVVLGGVHPTLMPEEASEHADAVVVGFGEKTWPQLLRDFKKGEMQKIYKSPKDVSLRDLTFPRRDLLKKRSYITINTIQATRGCPHECDFCITPVVVGGYYHRPVEDVIEEIKYMDCKKLIFLDPSPVEDAEYSKELYRKMIPLKLKWVGLATIKIAENEELLSLAVQSGCKGLLIGFESVLQDTLNQINKKFNSVDRYKQIVRKLHQYGIPINGTFVFGSDNDDKTVFRRTVEFADEVKIDVPRYTVYTPFPGTPAYKRLEKENRIIERKWSLYDGQHVVFQPAKMSADELQEGLYWAWDQTYNLKSIVNRLFGSRCQLGISILANIGYRYYAKKLPEYTKERMEKLENETNFNPAIYGEEKE